MGLRLGPLLYPWCKFYYSSKGLGLGKRLTVNLRNRILYGLMGVINIILCFVMEYDEHKARQRWPTRYRRESIFSKLGETISRLLLWFATPFIWALDHPLAACRYGFRYICKAFRRIGQKKHKPLRDGKTSSRECSLEKSIDVGEPPELPYEVLQMVSKDLHTADLVSASRVSKGLRAGLFGSGADVPSVLGNLQESVCHRSAG